MSNLFKVYKNLFHKEKRKWKYYNRLKLADFPLDSEEKAWSFILEYYKAGEKNEVFDKFIDQDKLRNRHTVSVFFLGILLSEVILGKDLKGTLKPDFRYLWFITSLYHDYSYLIEKDQKKHPPSEFKNIESVYDRFDIKYDVIIEGNFSTFTGQIVESYFDYKKETRRELDHGILGGIILYDRLRRNFDHAYERYSVNHPNAPRDHFIYKGLKWSICQYDFFEQISNAIIAHNIWFCTDSRDESTYQRHKLKELIIKNKSDISKKHKREDNPFLFLLILADTIEPIKREKFGKFSAKELLEMINIYTSSDKIIVEVLDDSLEYGRWFNSIKSLEDWMQVEVEDKGKSLEINIL